MSNEEVLDNNEALDDMEDLDDLGDRRLLSNYSYYHQNKEEIETYERYILGTKKRRISA